MTCDVLRSRMRLIIILHSISELYCSHILLEQKRLYKQQSDTSETVNGGLLFYFIFL